MMRVDVVLSVPASPSRQAGPYVFESFEQVNEKVKFAGSAYVACGLGPVSSRDSVPVT